jgi:adenylylsulfate kinase-like enzyme
VLWLYGADAPGKSTIGWEAYSLLAERGARVAYLDTDALSFCHGSRSRRVRNGSVVSDRVG